MIDEMHVRDVALIKDASMVFDDGLTVVTGETGSGKTAMLSALRLLVGERSGQSMVREGAKSAEVEGRFFLDEVPQPLEGEEGAGEDGWVVSRRLDRRGRSRVTIDGTMATVGALASGPGSTVDFCGQHEHQRLFSKAEHLAMVDAMAGPSLDGARDAYARALDDAREAAAELARLEELSRETDERLDQARFVYDRIQEVDPKEGELEELEEVLPRAEHAEALLQGALAARHGLSGDDGAQDLIAEALGELRQVSSHDASLQGIEERLQGALIELEDVSESLRRYADTVELDPAELQRMQGRQAALQGLMRRFGPTMDDVFARRDGAAEVLELAGGADDRLKEAAQAADAAEGALRKTADALDAERDRAIPLLEEAVAAQMARLEMAGASVVVRRQRLPRERWGADGPSTVELLYRPGEAMEPRPLAKVASGGELSRVMLAFKVAMGEKDSVETLIFDEVDAGVGGTTAKALAQVLKDLSRSHQVICVTHLPQVAVMGDTHYVLSKEQGDIPESVVRSVEGPDRVAEIARMLAGDGTSTSLAHAQELLAEAGA